MTKEVRDKIANALQQVIDGEFIAHYPATYTCDMSCADTVGPLYYFRLVNRSPGPYKRQIRREAILDIAEDGTLAGVELIFDMPPPPRCAMEGK